VLHQHLQDQMALALDHLSDIVMQRVREGLRDALTETVERAVAEEMALHIFKNVNLAGFFFYFE
jgi:hypothetical protein